jgi:SET domain-containing protein
MPESAQPDRDFIRVGKSQIDGTGVFAKRTIPRGTRIIEYTGEHVPIHQLFRVVGDNQPPRTYTFALNATTAIDGMRGGNASRFFNHSCAPNCEAYIFDEHVYIYAMRDVRRGEELTFDYRLAPSSGSAVMASDDPAEHHCRCGAPSCRGTLLSTTNFSEEQAR